MPITTAPQPFQPSVQVNLVKRTLWLLPLLLALGFVGMVAYWAEVNDANERAMFQNTLVADSQSVEAQLIGRQDMERTKLREVASRLGAHRLDGDAALKSMPEVAAGLDRLWNRLVWIDEDNQVMARATRAATRPVSASEDLHIQSSGQADHFVAPVQFADGRPAGQLLARYEITDLLKNTDLAWLNHRYQVDFLSELGEVIATTAVAGKVPKGSRYEKPLASFKESTLRLTPYESPASWKGNSSTLALLAGRSSDLSSSSPSLPIW